MPRNALPLWYRLFSRVTYGDGCWEFQGARSHLGHGVLGRGGRREGNVLAHRAAWEHFHGAIPTGLLVCHHCDNPPCVNPSHLFLGDYTANNRDMFSKGRAGSQRGTRHLPRGERHHSARLTETSVLAIRAAHAAGATLEDLGRRYAVSANAIANVIKRRTWAHV